MLFIYGGINIIVAGEKYEYVWGIIHQMHYLTLGQLQLSCPQLICILWLCNAKTASQSQILSFFLKFFLGPMSILWGI